MKFPIQLKRPGGTLAGIFSAAFVSVLLLCGAGNTPTGNVMTADLNASGHNLTNAATISATNVIVTGSLTAPSSFTLPATALTGTLSINHLPVGSGSTNVAAGNDARFPASVTGIRLGNGAGGNDAALTVGTGLSLSGGTLATTGAGTVSSVALAAPSAIYNIAGSPVTGSGTLTLNLLNQTANTIFAGPATGSAAAPGFRALTFGDLPVGTTSTTVAAGNDSRIVNALASNGNGSSLTNLDGFTALSFSSAATGTLTNATRGDAFYITLSAGTGPYTVNEVLNATGAQAGDKKPVTIIYPASANPTISFYDTSTSGTLLASTSATATASGHTIWFVFDGTNWRLQNNGALLTKNLGTGVQSALTNAIGGAGGVLAFNSVGGLTLPAPFYPVPVYNSCPSLIIDADYCSDRDDSMALAAAAELQSRGECRIIGAVADIKNQYSAPAISASLMACGLGNVPVGAMTARAITPSGTVGSTVAAACVNAFTQKGNNGLPYAEDSTALYRRLLAAAPASSVKIVTIGSASALYLLEQSSADSVSPLTGLQLINSKVIEIDAMIGAYPASSTNGFLGNQPEYNATLDPAADAVYAAVSVPVNFVGYQMGLTPAVDYCNTLSSLSPLYQARLAKGTNAAIYDPLAVLYAVRGVAWGGTTYFTTTTGSNSFNLSTGANTFTAGSGTQSYLAYGSGGSSAVDTVLQSLITSAGRDNPANPLSLVAKTNTWTSAQTGTWSGTYLPTSPIIGTGTTTGSFVDLLSMQDSAISAGNDVYLTIGHDGSSKNAMSFNFHYAGSASNSNYDGLGFFGTSLFFRVYASGNTVIGGTTDNGTDALQVTGTGTITSDLKIGGNAIVSTVGKGLQVKEGANAKQGTATLVSGTVTVSNTSVTSSSRIQVFGGALNASTALGVLDVSSQTAGTGFTITSYVPGGTTIQTGDLRTVAYEIFEPAP